MKLGDIKVEALKLMFMGGAMEIGADQLLDFADDHTYGYYLSRMPGAINRAFAVIERKGVLPLRAVQLTAPESGVARFHLPGVAPDLYEVARVSWHRHGVHEPNEDYMLEGGDLIVHDFDKDADYRLVYHPRIERIGAGTSDETEIDIPDEIAELIPYAIKGDLFRDDDSDEADAARARFEYALDEIRRSHAPDFAGAVQTVYGMGWMQ